MLLIVIKYYEKRNSKILQWSYASCHSVKVSFLFSLFRFEDCIILPPAPTVSLFLINVIHSSFLSNKRNEPGAWKVWLLHWSGIGYEFQYFHWREFHFEKKRPSATCQKRLHESRSRWPCISQRMVVVGWTAVKYV